MRYSIILLLALGLSAGMTACHSTKKSASGTTAKSKAKDNGPASTIQITAADNGKTIHAKTGDRIEATFNECIDCKQVWTIISIDKKQIEVMPNTYANKSCTNCTDGHQDNIFHLRVKAAGSSSLTFSYLAQKVTVTIDAN